MDYFLGEKHKCACLECVHFHAGTRSCDAFPDGIPIRIWAGVRSHRQRVWSDHGIVYSPSGDWGEYLQISVTDKNAVAKLMPVVTKEFTPRGKLFRAYQSGYLCERSWGGRVYFGVWKKKWRTIGRWIINKLKELNLEFTVEGASNRMRIDH